MTALYTIQHVVVVALCGLLSGFAAGFLAGARWHSVRHAKQNLRLLGKL